MAHIVWHSDNMQEKQLIFQLKMSKKICILLQMLIYDEILMFVN